MLDKIVTKLVEWTSDIEVDAEGNEHVIPWSLKEFLWEQFLIIVGIVIGALVF